MSTGFAIGFIEVVEISFAMFPVKCLHTVRMLVVPLYRRLPPMSVTVNYFNYTTVRDCVSPPVTAPMCLRLFSTILQSPGTASICITTPCFCTSKVCAVSGVCVYYYSTYYKAVRVGGGGDSGGQVSATRDDEPRPVWTRLSITH
jgi:hypothetical protein